MLHMIIGGAGCGKSTRLMERVQAQVDAGERVITLVPEQFSYEFDQKLYRILGPRRSTSWKPIALSRWHVLSFSVLVVCRTAEKMRMN